MSHVSATTRGVPHGAHNMAQPDSPINSKFVYHNGVAEVDGVRGLRQVSHTGPAYGTNSKRVELIDGTTPRYDATLDEPAFGVKVASRSDSVDDIAFPEGAVEIEQHYYKGEVLEEHYGEVNREEYTDSVIKEVPIYQKEICEVIVREQVINRIVEKVPKINYIDNVVEVENIIEKPVYREVPVKKTVIKQVPKPVREQRLIEKVRYVPVTEEVEVEKIVEVPGEVIIKPRHVIKEECIVTDKHFDKEVPVIVSQVVQPIMKDTKKKVRVNAKILNPDLHTTQVRVPKPVDLEFQQTEVETKLRYTALSEADYNSAFFQLNQHLAPEHRKALTPGQHLYVNKETGYPILRDANISFYRLPEDTLLTLEGYDVSSSSSSSSSSASVSQSGRRIKPSNRASKTGTTGVLQSQPSLLSKASEKKTTSRAASGLSASRYVSAGHSYVASAKASSTMSKPVAEAPTVVR